MKEYKRKQILNKLRLPLGFVKLGLFALKTIEHPSGLLIINGFYLDSDGNDSNDFYLHYFSQCLFVPFRTFSFSLGDRIGDSWSVDETAILQSKLDSFHMFDELRSFEDFINYLKKSCYLGDEVSKYENIAYTLFILQRFDDASDYLLIIISLAVNCKDGWWNAEKQRAQFLLDCIDSNDYAKGIEQLLSWQNETIKSLKIGDYLF